jgi:prevent-host-death family protein
MKHVGIFEAKTHLSSLLDEVEKGGEITITRHGKPVAKLVRTTDEPSADVIAQRRAAIARLRARAKARGVTVSHEEIKSWIEDGRH